MEGTLDAFEYILAEALGMTVDRLQNEMSNQEYIRWQAFYVWRKAQQELASKETR